MTTCRFRRISAAVIVALTLVPAGVIVAQETAPAPGAPVQAGPPVPLGGRGRTGAGYGQPGMSLEWLVRDLNLTDAQKASVNALLMTEHDTQRAQMDSLRQARQALDAAITRVPIDDGLLQAQVQQLSALEAQLALSHARTEARIFQVLDSSQQARARELLTQRDQQGGRRGRRGQ